MAHPARALAAVRLEGQLLEFDTDIVWDPDPSGPPSAARTFLRLCQRAPLEEPVLVLQEDAMLCRGFAGAVAGAWARAAGAVLALYAGRLLRVVPRLRAAQDRGELLGELGAKEYVPTVATVLPAGLPAAYAAWAERNAPPGFRHDDELLGAFCRVRGVPVLATIPCLANHDNGLPSMASHSHHGARTAWSWSDEDQSQRFVQQ